VCSYFKTTRIERKLPIDDNGNIDVLRLIKIAVEQMNWLTVAYAEKKQNVTDFKEPQGRIEDSYCSEFHETLRSVFQDVNIKNCNTKDNTCKDLQ